LAKGRRELEVVEKGLDKDLGLDERICGVKSTVSTAGRLDQGRNGGLYLGRSR
jgi:hypothetical protein